MTEHSPETTYGHSVRTVISSGGNIDVTCLCGWKATAPTQKSADRAAAEHKAAGR